MPEIERHLQCYVGSGPGQSAVRRPAGGILYRRVFAAAWRRARTAVGVGHLHFHDLHHTGNTLAPTGASTKEVMVRMGHANPRAALIYQHATAERDKAIAEARSDLAGLPRTPHLRSVPSPPDIDEQDPATTTTEYGPRDGRARTRIRGPRKGP